MRFLNGFILLFLLSFLSLTSAASENIFYALRFHSSDRMAPPIDTIASLKKNAKKIDILIPQAFYINKQGEVRGEIEPDILHAAMQYKLKIMPLVTNSKFKPEEAHQFLSDPDAEQKAIKALVMLTRQNHYVGIQLDFEMIPVSDRDLLTRFYEIAASEFHKNNFLISFAVAPVVTDQPTSFFMKKIYENWEGAYDLKKIGQFADFITIMAYNQHGGVTTPGATASLPWVEQTVKYATQYVTPNKISLGVPDFSTHWYTGSVKMNAIEKVVVRMNGVSYQKAIQLVKRNKKKLIWDSEANIFYVIYLKNWLNEYLFVENLKSFSLKYDLVKKYHLRGVSVFDLGSEDPDIWKVLMNASS